MEGCRYSVFGVVAAVWLCELWEEGVFDAIDDYYVERMWLYGGCLCTKDVVVYLQVV